MRLERLLQYVDAHAEGEPSRVVIGGIVDLPGETMLDKRASFIATHDHLRCLLLNEPRGMVALCADIVLPSSHPDAALGYLIIEPTDYPVMSGTNTINTATVILEAGLLPMTEPVTRFNLEAPAGLIGIEAECRDGKCVRITFENQPAFVSHLDVPLEVAGVGDLVVDVAYGGAFFAFVDATALGFSIVPDEAADLARVGELITRAAAEQIAVRHPGEPRASRRRSRSRTGSPRRGSAGTAGTRTSSARGASTAPPAARRRARASRCSTPAARSASASRSSRRASSTRTSSRRSGA